jgi:hypothetical protein
MMMGLAIAHHIREQVVFVNEPIVVPPHYNFGFERERDNTRDYGERIVVI